MNDEQVIKAFFEGDYENELTIKMMENDFRFPLDQVLSYIEQLCSIPYRRFIDYAYDNCYPNELKAEDITQCSDFEQCHNGICNVYKEYGNKAFDFIELGRLLQNDGVKRKDSADRKYGENQVKTAQQLGLVRCYYNKWYCTPLGKIYPYLPEQTQQSLLARTILRNKLYILLLSDAIVEEIKVLDYLSCIGESTRGRRLGSINCLFKVCEQECYRSSINIHTVSFSSNSNKTKEEKPNPIEISKPQETNSVVSAEPACRENNLCHYIDSITCIWKNENGNQLALKKLILLLSTFEYIAKRANANRLPILPEWEGLFLSQLEQYENCGTRTSTAFSTPFILLGNEPFWRLIPANGKGVEFKRAIMTFDKLQRAFECVEIDKELYNFIVEKDTRKKIEDHIEKLLKSKKYVTAVRQPATSPSAITSLANSTQKEVATQNLLYKYAKYFGNLKTSTIGGVPAPHKAILLISVIDLIDRRVIASNRILLNDVLENTFKINWFRYIGSEESAKCSINYPYYHMSSEPFWNLTKSKLYQNKSEYSVKELKQCFSYATIDEELFNLLTNKKHCSFFRVLLLCKYLAKFHRLEIDDGIEEEKEFSNSYSTTECIMRKTIDKSFIGRGFTVPVAIHSRFYEACGKRLKPSESTIISIVFEGIKYDAQLININLAELHTEILQVYWKTNEPKISDVLTEKYSSVLPKTKRDKGKDIGIYCTSQKGVFVIED